MVLGLIGKRELGPGGHKTLRNTFLSLRLGVTVEMSDARLRAWLGWHGRKKIDAA